MSGELTWQAEPPAMRDAFLEIFERKFAEVFGEGACLSPYGESDTYAAKVIAGKAVRNSERLSALLERARSGDFTAAMAARILFQHVTKFDLPLPKSLQAYVAETHGNPLPPKAGPNSKTDKQERDKAIYYLIASSLAQARRLCARGKLSIKGEGGACSLVQHKFGLNTDDMRKAYYAGKREWENEGRIAPSKPPPI